MLTYAARPAGQAEAQMKLSLTCAANGDNYEAIEHCLQCLKQCRLLNDHHKEVLNARVLARTKKKKYVLTGTKVQILTPALRCRPRVSSRLALSTMRLARCGKR